MKKLPPPSIPSYEAHPEYGVDWKELSNVLQNRYIEDLMDRQWNRKPQDRVDNFKRIIKYDELLNNKKIRSASQPNNMTERIRQYKYPKLKIAGENPWTKQSNSGREILKDKAFSNYPGKMGANPRPMSPWQLLALMVAESTPVGEHTPAPGEKWWTPPELYGPPNTRGRE